MKFTTIKTNVMFFTSSDYKDAKKECDKYCSKMKQKKNTSSVAIYFDDDRDMYEVTQMGLFGDVIKKELYSWDDVSNYIHDNI